MALAFNPTSTVRDPYKDFEAAWAQRQADEQQRLKDIAMLMENLAKTKDELEAMGEEAADLQRQIEELEREIGREGGDSEGGSNGTSDPEKEKKLKALKARLEQVHTNIDLKTREVIDISAQLKTAQNALDDMIRADNASGMSLAQLMKEAAQTTQKVKGESLASSVTTSKDQLQKLFEQAREVRQEELILTAGQSAATAKVTSDDVQKAARDANVRISELMKEIHNLLTTIKAFQAEISKLKGEISTLEAEWDSLNLGHSIVDVFTRGKPRKADIYDQIQEKRGQVAQLEFFVILNCAILGQKTNEVVALDRTGLLAKMQEISKLIGRLAELFKGGISTQAQYQEANALIVMILSILKVILAEAQGKKNEGDQMMSEGTIGQYEFTVNDAINNSIKTQRLNQFAEDMRKDGENMKYIMLAVAILTAPTNPALAALFLTFTALQFFGVLDKLVNELAEKMEPALGKEGAHWMAEGIVFAAILIATMGVGAAQRAVVTTTQKAIEREATLLARSAASEAFHSAAQTTNQAVREAVQQQMEKTVENTTKRQVHKIAQVAAQAAYKEAAKEAAKVELKKAGEHALSDAALQRIHDAGEKAAIEAGKKAASNSIAKVSNLVASGDRQLYTKVNKIAQTQANAAVQDMRVNYVKVAGGMELQHLAASDAIGEAARELARAFSHKTEEELKDDPTYKAMMIVTQILNVLMGAAGGYMTCSAASAQNSMKDFTGRSFLGATRERLQAVGTALHLSGDGMTAMYNYQTAEIMNHLAHAHRLLAQDEFQATMWKSILDQMHDMRENDSEHRAFLFDSQEKAVQRVVKTTGLGEQAAARVLMSAV